MKMQSLKFFTILAVASAIVTLSAVAKSPESPEAKFDFKLYSTGNSSPAIQSSATGKEDNQDASVNAALEREAQAVVAGARKN